MKKIAGTGFKWAALCLMMLMLTVLTGWAGNDAEQAAQTWLPLAAAEEAGGDQDGDAPLSERDGSRIESISLKWLTEDSTVNNEGQAVADAELSDAGLNPDSHLYLATASKSALSMTYRLEVSFSGQYDYAPGDITITIPAKVLYGRTYAEDQNNGTAGVTDESVLMGDVDLPVPKAPSTKGDFNWQLINGNYVLTNTRSIGATSTATFDIAIFGVDPTKVVDMSESAPITAHCEVVTNQGNVIELTSDPIIAQIDTCAQITAAHKSGTLYEERPGSLPESLLANLPEGSSPDEYLYVGWYTYPAYTSNQPFSLDMTDTLGEVYESVDGQKRLLEGADEIFLGSTSGGAVVEEGEIDFEMDVADHISASDGYSYSKSVTMWSAYPKSAFYVPKASEPERTYIFSNSATWTLTESDAAVSEPGLGKPEDEQKVTTKTAEAAVTYKPIRYEIPIGHFKVNKYTESKPYKDYSYGYALNKLEKGEDVDMNFVLETIGYGYPWTSEKTMGASQEELEELGPDDYGVLGWKQITEDYQTFFNMENTALTSEDFYMKSLRITTPTRMKYSKNVSGKWGYYTDSSLPTPDLTIEYRVEGSDEWLPAARAVWGEDGRGTLAFKDVSAEISTNGSTVYFPENTVDVRHSFVSNVFNGETVSPCDIAAIDWYTYPTITLKASERVQEIVDELFAMNDSPSTKFKNDVQMDVDGWVNAEGDGVRVLEDDADSSRATLAGASYGVTMSKSSRFNANSIYNGGDNDVEERSATIHYTLTVNEQSNLKVRTDYDEAVAEGVIPAETSGVFYDLLPLGVSPKLDTIRLRSGDKITNVYTVSNYKDTGRMLLVVEADLTPSPVRDYNATGYADKPTLSFDAAYAWDDIKTYGRNPQNYAAFESTAELRQNTLGTITGQKGDPDDPTAGNNNTTPSLPQDIAEALTDLDPNTDESRFVYAKADTWLDILTTTLSGINKAVSDDLKGVWTQGLANQEQVTVYEGGKYTYRLKVTSAENTETHNITIFDSIENYIVPDPEGEEHDGTKAEDHAHTQERIGWQGDWETKGQWRGTLASVDVSAFIDAGASPVLYYSTTPYLALARTEPMNNFSGTFNLENTGVWTQVAANQIVNGVWTAPEGVTAIAIDAEKTPDGSQFVLGGGESVSAYLHMIAPDDNGSEESFAAKGAYAHVLDEDGKPVEENGRPVIDWEAARDAENNMYAFNNTFLRCSTQDTAGNSGTTDIDIIQNDYTRVGIIPYIINVQKVWKDQNNHDGLRAQSVTLTLLRRTVGVAGEPEEVLDEDGEPVTITLSEENKWKLTFPQVDAADENGRQYIYSFKESESEGYTAAIEFDGDNNYILTNSHGNETVTIDGQKVWNDNDDALGLRPDEIKVHLYCDGEYAATTTARASNDWKYSFGNLEKWIEGGEAAHDYTVKEEYVPKYVPSSTDYKLLTNDYYPYGDLEILKMLENADSDAAKANVFAFTLELLAEQTAERIAADELPVPLTEEYDAAKYELNGEDWVKIEGSDCKVTNGSEITLLGGQKLVISELPSEANYRVTEAEVDGFTATAENDEGVIRAGQTATAAFTNRYAAKGELQLSVFKKLTGHAMTNSQFRFELKDKTEGSKTYDQVIRSARNGAATTTQEGGPGNPIISTAEAFFGVLDYTEADVGTTFVYEISETRGNKAGYTYDETVYTVTVNLADNGDGTLAVTHRITAVDGETADLPTAGEDGKTNLTFENEYKAEGSLTLRAWKTLEGRELENEEFTFELYNYDTKENKTVGEAIGTVKNDAEGNVVFAALSFTQDDVSLDDDEPATYTYLMHEVPGSDPTVEYSAQEYLITVKVYDNNDGTLSFVQDNQIGTRKWDTCDRCKGNGYEYFILSMYTGTSQVNYFQYNSSNPSNPMSPIPFCTECRGACKNKEGDWCSKCGGSGLEANSPDSFWLGGYQYKGLNNEELDKGASDDVPNRAGLLVKRADGEDDGIVRYAQVYIENSNNPKVCTKEGCGGTGIIAGELEITGNVAAPVFENELKPGALSVSKLVSGENPNPEQEFTFHVRLTGEDVPSQIEYVMSEGEEPEVEEEEEDKEEDKDEEEDGNEKPAFVPPDESNAYHAPQSVIENSDPYAALEKSTGKMVFFRYEEGVTTTDPFGNSFTPNFEGGKRDAKQNSGFIYYKLSELEDEGTKADSEDDWPWWTSDRTSIRSVTMAGAFKPASCRSMFSGMGNATTYELNMLDTSEASSFYGMFYNCKSATQIDVSRFDTSNGTSFRQMFYYCSDLTSLDVSHFNTSNGTDFNQMFVGCSKLTSLDVSHFNTSNGMDFGQMFFYCSDLTSLDVSHFDTSKGTNFSYMFYECYKLTTLDVSGWDTSSGTDFSYMFHNCYGLTTLDVSGWDTSSGMNFDHMFYNCNQLTTLDVSGWDTSSGTNFSNMFGTCSSLTTLDVSGWDASSGTNFMYMFAGCSSLTTLDLSGWDTSSGTNFSYMFSGCNGLTTLDVSGLDTGNGTSFSYMFYNCKMLTTLDVSNFDTGNGTSFSYMFYSFTGHLILGSGFHAANSTGSMISRALKKITLEDETSITLTTDMYPSGNNYTGNWINVDTGDKLSSTKALLGDRNHGGTWEWQEKTGYKVYFNPGEGTGAMTMVSGTVNVAQTVTPAFYRYGYKISHFVDGKDNIYALDADGNLTFAAGTFTDGAVLTLTPVWEQKQGTVIVTENSFTFKLLAGEKATFNNLPAGTAYEVWEDTPAGWVLVSKVNDSGEIEPLETSEAVFTNQYTPDKTQANLRAGKQMDGKAPAEGQFTFTLSDEDGVLQTKSNAAGGAVVFDAIEYRAAGEYTYTIRETAGSDNTVEYDSTVYTAVVTVTDNGAGVLSSSVVYYDADEISAPPVFENSTKPGSLTVSKTIEGATEEAQDQSFAFKVRFTNDKGEPWSGTVILQKGALSAAITHNGGLNIAGIAGGQSFTISEIPAGVNYAVEETGSLPGWTLKDAENATGTIESAVNSTAAFTNTYSAKGTAAPKINKQLVGRTLKEDEFTFELRDADGNTVSTATNAADGTVSFEDLAFTQEGTYIYTICEVEGTDTTVNYTDKEITVTIEMTDEEGEGRLTPTITYAGGSGEESDTLVNTIKTGELSVSKTVVSTVAAHEDKAFSFTLSISDAQGMPLTGVYPMSVSGSETQLTVTDGTGRFELKDGETAIISELPHGANYSVLEDEEDCFAQSSTGARGSITANETASAAFTNTYASAGEYVFEADKTLENMEMTEEQFAFALLDADGYEISEARNDADGHVIFDKLTFTHEDAGEHVYRIAEKDYGESGIVYDETVYEVTLTVTDNGDGTLSVTPSMENEEITFVNVYDVTEEVSLDAKKVIEGRTFKDGDSFTFDIRALDGAPLPVDEEGQTVESVTIEPTEGAEADFSFGTFTFTMEDVGKTYEYEVSERKGDIANMEYDTQTRTISISIADNGEGSPVAKLTGELVFTNVYTEPEPDFPTTDITVRKVWDDDGYSGRPLSVTIVLGREEEPEFSRVRVLSEKNNWKTTFYGIRAGYTYYVKEVSVEAPYCAEITQNGNVFTITNHYIPETGDKSHIGLWAGLAILAMLSLTGIAVTRKRRMD